MLGLVALTAASLALVSAPTVPAVAQETTTTTEPPPDTTTTLPPDTTTTLPPDTTTTLPPPDTTTTLPPPDTTTTSTPKRPAAAVAAEAQAGKLTPAETITVAPEFAALSSYQRSLVQQLQTATDLYAVRRVALVDLQAKVAAAKDALQAAWASEQASVTKEVVDLAAATDTGGDTHGRSRHPRVGARISALRALGHHLADAHHDVQRTRVGAQAALDHANADLAAQDKAVADAWADRSAADAEIERELGPDAVNARPDGITATLVSEQAGQPTPLVVDGIGQPIPGAAVASPFGLRNDPLSNGAGFHPGIDFAATFGTPIHAAAAGVVVIAGDCDGYGLCVVVDHGNSVATLYAHQSSLLVGVGQHVNAGDVVGLVGATGNATGPHLHFEVRLHGIPIDPVLAFG